MNTKRILITLASVIVITLMSSITALADQDVEIISPSITSGSGIVYCDNFMLSLKVAPGQALDISVIKDVSTKEQVVMEPTRFISDKELNFFTSQINDISPGVYAIVIDSIDYEGNITETTKEYLIIAKPEDKEDSSDQIFTTPESNTLNFFRDIFKGIFGE